MKKLINRPEAVVDEMLAGLVALHPGLTRLPGLKVIVRSDADQWRDSQVALISGGGSGHEPAHAGYVGPGMLAGAVAGDVFTSPDPDSVLAAIRAVGGQAGVVLLVKNYTGDRLNFGLAAELARAEGIAVEMVVVADDVALPDSEHTAGPRGLAGTILVHKIAGAAAEAGLALAEVAAEARATAASLATMGVALSACTVPAVGQPGFILDEDEVELGLGIHGEPGVRRAPMEPADALVDHLLGPILGRFSRTPERVALLVNGLGGTTPMELAIVARRALIRLADLGVTVERAYAGTFLSALDMAGFSLTVLEVDDARLSRLDAPTAAPAWPNAAPRSRPGTMANEIVSPGPSPGSVRQSPPATEAGRTLGAAIGRACSALIEDAPRLTALDQAVGDGDLGISLARGANAVLEALPAWPLDDPAATFQALSATLRRSLGGTSGPLYAVFFLRAAVILRHHPDLWADAFWAGYSGVAELGGATDGDRTMLDALIPAVNAFAAALAANRSTRDALGEAAKAAADGARATTGLLPRRGRSSYLGDRVLGHPDPGAEAVAVWLKAVADS